MNGFGEHGRDEDAFGPSKGGIVSSFDAFRKCYVMCYTMGKLRLSIFDCSPSTATIGPAAATGAFATPLTFIPYRSQTNSYIPAKTKKTYLVQGRNSSAWTVTLILTCIYLSWSEITRWFAGTTTQSFSVEKGVSHDMQINLDIIVAMRCADLHVNMQDAAGDRTLAGDLLRKDPTSWAHWTGRNLERGMHELGKEQSAPGWEELWDVHEQLGKAKRRKFSKTPRVRGETDSCRIYGSMDGNKVQGDFHITARGHGYMEFGEHLDHSSKFSSKHGGEKRFTRRRDH